MVPHESATPTTVRPRRRTVAKAAAWTVPTIAVAGAAPAQAASPCASVPSVAFRGSWTNASAAGWLTSTGTGGLGFMNADTQFGAFRDPAPGTGTATVSTSITLVLSPNTTYTMTFPVVAWNVQNTQTATITVSGVGTQSVSHNTDSVKPDGIVYTFTTGAATTYTITVRVSVPRPSASATGDDIVVGSPTLVCGTRPATVQRAPAANPSTASTGTSATSPATPSSSTTTTPSSSPTVSPTGTGSTSTTPSAAPSATPTD